jgi:hypothetical protein
MVTKGINPNYVPPDVAFKAVFEGLKYRLGAGVWDDEGKNVWWGDWPQCPEWVAIMKARNMNIGGAEPQTTFTAAEVEALKKKHGTADVDWRRAAAVKGQMQNGVTTIEAVAAALSPTWGRTQISLDLAALKAASIS